jgi:hypothetical protein
MGVYGRWMRCLELKSFRIMQNHDRHLLWNVLCKVLSSLVWSGNREDRSSWVNLAFLD